ncbi:MULTISPECIES: ParB/RepB/Spo0J family partition protein [Sporomusa]|jgi:ParB family chromosome partitioning protein|uniref:Chromosome-partitioning protein ParB n=1 Tax=Sporomusa sphaeroides DSM 2875 TaxID=1337886 RepID=A0ABM9W081_9FIRM|nr:MULTISPECIES: ParB/RepB/Spo0J family partition protein [Sporomusa]MCM0759389.1 ParB/RepB/Spo0J family partition protein [Sporomusa sphaeroides DSM 2875]OLS56476.1 putative chromosome-partitioning protein ParB [Sporomusa sphaeroides DSM 2875]CVK18571.1 putative chromosome-partitioning protein ParB [Sporomusa sphaeroides DSM 2875]HML35544.1 ParB/RepB/Spo0J family partition protein [Sporomusa sphaeroides]
MSKRGLGRGLDALFAAPDAAQAIDTNEPVNEIAIKDITPNLHQPRRDFDEEALAELAQSIKQHGVIQPVVVRKTLSGYELVAGERRWRASQIAGLKMIPAVVREYTDAEMMEIALIENLQRRDLNAIEEAMAFRSLMEEFGLTQEEVAQRIGRSRSMIANTVRLLKLHPEVQSFVSRGTLNMGQARPLLALENPELQLDAANQIMEEDLSARDAEELVRRLAARRPVKPAEPKQEIQEDQFFMNEFEDRLKVLLGTQVRIKPGKLKSKIEIEYYSNEDLERIMEMLSTRQEVAGSKFHGQLIV